MRKGMKALAFVLLMLVGSIAPVLCLDENDALDQDDYKIVVANHHKDSLIPNIVENGKSASYSIYITNFSDHPLDFSFTGQRNATYLSYDDLESVTVMPTGDERGRDFVKVVFTIHVEEITSSHKGGIVWLIAHVADVIDESIAMESISFAIDVKSSFDTSYSFNKFFGFIDNTLPAPFDSPYVPFFVTLIFVILGAYVAIRLLIPTVTKHIHDKNGRSGKILTMLALIFAIILFIDPGLRILGADLSIILQVRKFSLSVLVIALAVVIWKLYIIAVDRILKKMGQDKKSSVDETYFPIFSMLGKAVLWATGIGTILNIYGLDLTGILISAGIVTLGITLGAQSVLSQMFNGVSLLLTRPFSEGDYLQIGGEVYIVKHVKLMYTEFLSEEKDRIITIPNNTVASATVTNISKYDKAFRLFIYFQIPYGQEVEKVEEVLLQMAEENKYVMHNYNKYKKPILKLIEFQDSGILMRLDVTVVDIAKWRVIESDMKKELYVKLSEAGIEMPFNRLEVTIMNSEVEKSTA